MKFTAELDGITNTRALYWALDDLMEEFFTPETEISPGMSGDVHNPDGDIIGSWKITEK